MASVKNGGWVLSGTTLQYRECKKDNDGAYTSELSTTVLASITGLSASNIINGTGNDAGKIMVKDNETWRELNSSGNTDVEITDEESEGKIVGTITIASVILPKQANKSISVTSATGHDYTMVLADADKVNIATVKVDNGTVTTEKINHGTNGTTTITGNLTAGYTIATNGKSATYYTERANQVLATITGLAKNYTVDSTTGVAITAAFTDAYADTPSVGGTGHVTLSKVAANSSDVSALGTSAITLTMNSTATANNINYYLKLNESNVTSGTYKQTEANDEAPYWTVSGTKATYQYYSPTGYELTDAKNNVIATGTTGDVIKTATKVKVTAAKTTTVVTVTGLANDITTNATDTTIANAKNNPISNSVATAVGTGQARLTTGTDGAFVKGLEVKSGKDVTDTGGKPTTTTTNGTTTTTKGEVEINITKAVLPTRGNVVVTPGTNFNVTVATPAVDAATGSTDFYNSADAAATSSNVVKKQRIWVISGNTATYKEVDLAYYTTSTADGKTTIKCTPQTTGTALATIKGLNADWLADESNLTRTTKDTSGVITAIKGITFTKTAGYDYVTTNNVEKIQAKTDQVGEITLAKEVLDGANVTIGNSDNYRLALLADTSAVDKGGVAIQGANDNSDIKFGSNDFAYGTVVTLPKFSNYKWNLSGTTATLKGDIAAGYTAADNGKTITYTAADTNQTLATVSGLKKGTQLERDTTDNEGNTNYRKIGNYIGTTFTDGLSIVTDDTATGGTLTHGTTAGEKYLNRMPITISKLVLDSSKVTLNSNFFTLNLNKAKATSETDTTAIADSRTYVLNKTEAEAATNNIGWHGSLGSTAILKKAVPAYYEAVTDSYGTTKTINYTKPGTATILATIKGLNASINENDISFDPTGTNKVITINSIDALTTGNVTITGEGYTLALADTATSGIKEAELSGATWAQTGTTVNYTALVTSPGYKLNADANTITYTKEATTTPTTLATITGLRAGLVKVDPNATQDSDSDPGETAETDDQTSWQYSGVDFNNGTGTITIGKEALNGTSIAIKGTANYKLALADGLNKATAPDPAKRWVISGTTATYKVVTPEYYTYNASNNTITYTKAVDAKYQNETTGRADYSSDESLKGKTIPALVSISGLKSGLVVNDNGDKIGYYKSDGTFIEDAITFGTGTDAKKITINDAGVLNGTTVKIDNTAHTNGYKIELSSALVNDVKPQLEGDATWTISRGTATLKGNVAAGYSNSSDGKSIDFSAKKTNTAIATITGLKNTATTTDGLTLGTTVGTDDHIITVDNDLLSTSDVKLTTNIAILGKPYQLALDAYDASTNLTGTKQKDDVDTADAGKLNKWSISGTTATYYTWRDAYYSLNNGQDEDSDTITYHAAGEGLKGSDVLAKVEGLASGLVTIQNDQIRGIAVGEDVEKTVDSETVTSFEEAEDGTIIQLSSNVLPTTTGKSVVLTNAEGYTLRLDADDTSIPLPKDAVYYDIATTGVATVKIKRAISAGFAYDDGKSSYTETTSKKTKLTYNAEQLTGDQTIGTISGLDKDKTVINSDGSITGITINQDTTGDDARTITLSLDVLNGPVTFTTTNTTNPYKLKLDSDVTGASSAPAFEKTTGKFDLRAGATNGGYTLGAQSTTDGVVTQKITYLEGGNKGKVVASITGLKNIDKDKVVVTEVKDGTTVTGYKITISAGALNAQGVEVKSEGDYSGSLTLELDNADPSATGYVAASEATDTWDLTNGTATFTHKVTAGYEVDPTDSKKIIYTPESSIVSTLNNLSKEVTWSKSTDGKTLVTSTKEETVTDSGTNEETTVTKDYGITFDNGVFKVTDENVLAHKSVKLTTKATGKDSNGANITADYTVDLDADIKAKTADPVWNKAANATVATYTATTDSGYSISGDNKNITYSSDPTVTILATVNGLNKDSVAYTEGNKSYVGIGVTDSSTTPATTTYTKGLEVTTERSGDTVGVITIGKNVLNNAKVSLANSDNYTFTPETGSNAVPTSTDAAKVWAISGTTATYKNVTPAHYALDTGSKSFTYTAQKDVTGGTIATIKGLKSGLKLDESGKVINADGTTAEGLTIKSNGTVLLNSAVLGTSKEITSDTKPLELASGIKTIKEEATEWVGSGTTYTYKKYDKAYFTYDSASNNKKITYTAATTGTTYATISNLASDATITFAATDEDNLAKGGTIKISADQLIEKDVTLKVNSGTFALAFADNFDADKKSSIDSSTLAWGSTNATTAVLKGTQSAGYTLSEDAKSITYKKTEGTVTLATISGLKSGFELPAETTFDTDSSGNQIITLDKTMLGTSNVTLKGDGYKLALGGDAASETEKAEWVKADNATKATFTQQTYNGFTESADGKSLTYIKNTSKIDLATINGLSKDLTQSQMAVVYNNDAGNKTSATAEEEVDDALEAGALVVLDDVNKVIHVKKAALSAKVTLANKDGYTFNLIKDNGDSVTELGGDTIQSTAPKLTFNNGTMSIVAGTDDKWVLSDDKKTLNYTAAKYDTLATVSGLPKTLTTNSHDGISVSNNDIKINKAVLVSTDATTNKDTSLLANNAKIVLTNKKVGNTTYDYTITLDDIITKSGAPAADKKVWALSGTNLSLKEVTSAYYLNTTTTSNNIKTQTITYVAEKVGGEIAKIAGVPANTVSLSSDATAVYVGGDTTKPAFTATMNNMETKTIEVGSNLRDAIKEADKAVTLTLTGTGYTFTSNSKGTPPTDGSFDFITGKSFTALKSGGKATVIKEVSNGWTDASTDTKLIFAKSADSIVATVNGLRKDFDPNGVAEDSNASDLDFSNKLVTVGNTALNNAAVTLTIPSKGEVYNLALANNVASSLRSGDATVTADDVADWTTVDGGWMNQTDWVVSGGTASYKTYNKANYYIKPSTNASTTPNSIAYNAPTAGTTYARITGLNKTAESVASSVDLEDYLDTVENDNDIIITLGAKELGTSKVTLAVSKANTVATATTASTIVSAINTDLNDKIADGNKVAPNFKLALDTKSDSENKVTLSGVKNAVWDTNGTVANLTGTITKGYKLSNDQKSITYQAADSKLQVIAKVSGIKKGSQITDSNVTQNNDNENLTINEIKLKAANLANGNVVLTGEGYKLTLDTDVVLDTNSISGAAGGWHDQTEWVANNGTFTYKTYDKAYYKVNDTGMQVIYKAAADNTKNNANHRTYAQITGLSKTADASAIAAIATVVATGADATATGKTVTLTTENEGVITLSANVLNKANVKLTDSMISASLDTAPVLYTGGYTLALGSDVTNKSTASNVIATVSGTGANVKATWAGTQGAGYFLTNDEQNITYYSAKKEKQTIATVTGLNSTVSTANNDAFTTKYNAGTNTVTLDQADVGEKVGISGTAAFSFSSRSDTGYNVTGSSSADKLTFASGSNSINAGGGNDIVTLAGGSNTFFYASGNGNDIITGFTATDTIKVTNVAGTTTTSKKVKDNDGNETTQTTYKNNIEVYADEKKSTDTLIKVNSNVIRLKGYTGTVTVLDKDNKQWSTEDAYKHDDNTPNGSFIADTANVLADDDYAMTPQNLFADDNYAMTPNLSSIVKNSTSSDYATDDLVADDATTLTKQSTAVSYSDKK